MITYNPTWLFVNGVAYDEDTCLAVGDTITTYIEPTFSTAHPTLTLTSSGNDGTITYLITDTTNGTTLLSTTDTQGSATYTHSFTLTAIGNINFNIVFSKTYATTVVTLTEEIDLDIPVCGNLTVEKTSCENYTVTLDTSSAAAVAITLTQVGSSYTESYSLDTATNTLTADIVLPGDGVFILTMVSEALGTTYQVIHEFCNLKDCYIALLKEIYCADETCCDESPTDRYQLQKIRYTFNVINSLYQEYMALIKRDQLYYLNLGTVDATRTAELSVISGLIDKLNDKLGECSACTDDDDSTPCGC